MKYLRNKRILPWYQLSICEKRIQMRFMQNAKFQYGPKLTPDTYVYMIGQRKNNTTVVNPNFQITQIRKTLAMTHTVAFNKGMLVMSAPNLEIPTSLGNRHFYFFSAWHKGFLTNFAKLMRRASVDNSLGQGNLTRRLPQECVYVKRIPQLPNLCINLQMEHWCVNEARLLKIPYVITIEPEFHTHHYHAAITIAHSGEGVPKTVLMMLIKETHQLGKLTNRLFFSIRQKLTTPSNMGFYLKKYLKRATYTLLNRTRRPNIPLVNLKTMPIPQKRNVPQIPLHKKRRRHRRKIRFFMLKRKNQKRIIPPYLQQYMSVVKVRQAFRFAPTSLKTKLFTYSNSTNGKNKKLNQKNNKLHLG